MRYGFYLPTRGAGATPASLIRLVAAGEDLGFHSVVIADHIVFPVTIGSKYPYSLTGAFPGDGDALEQLTLMAFIAARTERLRLVTSVMILPHRNPVLAAKMIATIDVLSEGRVTVGVGVGWLEEEFQALSAPAFARRGAVSNEFLEIFKKLWTETPATHSGEFYRFEALRCLPLPAQKPHPPIWIGGHSQAALKRVARYGDGWHPVGANPAVPLAPTELAGLIDQLRRLVAAEGRDFEALTISFKAPRYDPGAPVRGADRRPFTGTGAQLIDDIRTYQSLGVSELIFDFRSDSVDQSIAAMEQFATDIMASAGSDR